MKVIERRVLRGPNIYATRPVYLAILDLEALDDVPSTALPGFVDGLLAAVPTLHTHRCSPGHVGGFVERLRAGTYMAHTVEHVSIELQCLAGHEVGFGRARQVRGKPRHYRVVFAYRAERVAEAALNLAIALVSALAAGKQLPQLDDRLAQLRRLVERAAMGPSTRAIVEAAQQRGIPTMRLTEQASMFLLGWGARQQRIQATMTSQTSHIAVGIAGDKDLTKRLLHDAGLPVPQGRTVATLEGALAAARASRHAVAIKPLDGNQGKGVTTAVRGDAAVAAAFERAREFGRRVIVEEHIEGRDYRVLVVGDELVAAACRVPPEVTGDGRSSVRALVDAANADPRRGSGHGNVLSKMRLDEAAATELAGQDLDFDAVPAAGRVVRLRGNANLSTGGTARDVTADVHPDTAAACVRAAQRIGLDVAGIDLVCRDIGQPLAAQGGALIEVNAAPGIRMHEHPSAGERQHVGRAIVASLFGADGDGGDGRIPVVAVAGSKGKTSTTQTIAHVLQRTGCTTGVASSDGIAIDGRRVASGDCTGYQSARTVLTAPRVDCAVLETACGGILHDGLAFDQCDVGVVLNIDRGQVRQPGQDGIDTVEALVRVMGLVVATARKAAVLNADDPLCVALAARMPRRTKVIYFGFDATQPALARHLARGGRAVYAHNGMLFCASGSRRVSLLASAQLFGTPGAEARHDAANCMAACAVLLALDVPRQRIAAGLASFMRSPQSTASQEPLQTDLAFRSAGVTSPEPVFVH